jgi:hypothetical protein
LSNSTSSNFFLPFDIEQLQVLSDQSAAFRTMNQLAWKVDKLMTRSGNVHPIADQLNTWYSNTSLQSDPKQEVFEGVFDTSQVIPGWSANFAQKQFFNSLLRISCRNCHMAQAGIFFDTETNFLASAQKATSDPTSVVSQICSHGMPDSLQTLRLFWQSTKPAQLEDYLRSKSLTAQADTLHNCGPGNVATLDPYGIQGALIP